MTNHSDPTPSRPARARRNLWALLWEPSPAITKPEHRRDARLLSTLLVFLILQDMVGVYFVLVTDKTVPALRNPFLYAAVIINMFFITAYYLSRTRHYRLGAAVVIASLPVLIYAAVLSVPATTASSSELWIWLVMAVLVGCMFFSVRVMSAYTLISVGAMLVLPLISERLTFRSVLIPFIFVTILSTLAIVWTRHRNLVEQDRQAELSESEMRYRTLLETSFDGIVFHNAEVVLDANPGFAQMFGYELDDVRGMALADFAVRGSGNTAIARAIMQGTKQVHETRGVKRDGTVFDIEVVGKMQPYRGQVVQMTAVRDISERKRAEAAERSQRLLAEALRDTAALVTSTLDLDEVFDRILTNIGHVVPHDVANIMLIDSGRVQAVRSTGYEERGLDAELLEERRWIDELPALHRMLQSGEPLALPNTRGQPDGGMTPAGSQVFSYLGAPIRLEGKVIGFINLGSATPGFFTQMHADHLQMFADQSAVAIHNARLYKELERYSERLEQAVEERTSELWRTKERVETILNNSPDAVLLLSTEGLVRVGNPAFGKLFGYDIDSIFNQPPSVLVAPSYAQKFTAALQAVLHEHVSQRFEVTARRRDGGTFDADVALAPIVEHDGIDGVVCSLRDISALKEVERMKDAFVSNVSHELRTPITNLKLYEKMLAMNQRPEKQTEYLATLERETERLARIIEDLLLLSRLDQQHISLASEPVDLNALVRDHVVDRELLARQANVTLTYERCEDVPTITSDKGLLGQVLSILINNAVNYTPPGGSVVISPISRQADGKRWAGFRVRDTGPGIPEDEQPHVFERFFRGSAGVESGAPGTGLGLAIAKSIVDQYNGRITFACEEAPGSGTTFDVLLPADGSGAPA